MSNDIKPWEPYFPNYVELYYVDYNSNLDNNTDTLAKCVADNNLYPISESIDDWWDFPEGTYLEGMKRQMIRTPEQVYKVRKLLWLQQIKSTALPFGQI